MCCTFRCTNSLTPKVLFYFAEFATIVLPLRERFKLLQSELYVQTKFELFLCNTVDTSRIQIGDREQLLQKKKKS